MGTEKTPCCLYTVVSTGRNSRVSYEFYHPSVFACQLGFGQLPVGVYSSAVEVDPTPHMALGEIDCLS
ncbi:hypothetical protein DAI22_08g194177 [Oryza sativa Japonica Group]|nr:hypothetical protein DAI22_08g194177 [Oryza sativa Japonica Group]